MPIAKAQRAKRGYMNARYYDPNIGIFISPDTIIPDPTNVMDYNRYTYSRGNPIKNNDPTGHYSMPYDNRMLFSNMEVGGGGGGGAVALVFMAGVAYMVVVDELTKEIIESFPLNTPQPSGSYFPAPDLEPQVSNGGFYDDSGNTASSTVLADPLLTPSPTDNFLTVGGVESNDTGDWAVQEVGAQLPVRVGQYEVTINGSTRRYDGRLMVSGRYVEIKGSASPDKVSISLDTHINWQISLDSQLARPPLWIFVGKSPSSGLSESLDENGIPWIVLNPLKPFVGGGRGN